MHHPCSMFAFRAQDVAPLPALCPPAINAVHMPGSLLRHDLPLCSLLYAYALCSLLYAYCTTTPFVTD